MLQQVWPVWQQWLCRVLQHLSEHETDSSGLTIRPPTCTVTFPLLHYITLQMEHCWEEVLKRLAFYQNQRNGEDLHWYVSLAVVFIPPQYLNTNKTAQTILSSI